MSDQTRPVRRAYSSHASLSSSQWSLAVNDGSENDSSQSQNQNNNSNDATQIDDTFSDVAYRGITGDGTAFADFTQRNRHRNRDMRDIMSTEGDTLRHRRPQTARQDSQQSLKELSLYSEIDEVESPTNSPQDLHMSSQRRSPVRENGTRNFSAPAESSQGSSSAHDLRMIGAVHEEEGQRPPFPRMRRAHTC